MPFCVECVESYGRNAGGVSSVDEKPVDVTLTQKERGNKICITAGDILQTPSEGTKGKAFILPFSKGGTFQLNEGYPGGAFASWVGARFPGEDRWSGRQRDRWWMLQDSLSKVVEEEKTKTVKIGSMSVPVTVITHETETVYGVWEEVILDPDSWKEYIFALLNHIFETADSVALVSWAKGNGLQRPELAFVAQHAHLGIVEHLIDYFGRPDVQPMLDLYNINNKTVHVRDWDKKAARNNALNAYRRCAEPSVQCKDCEFGNVVWVSSEACLCQDCFSGRFSETRNQQSFFGRIQRNRDAEHYDNDKKEGYRRVCHVEPTIENMQAFQTSIEKKQPIPLWITLHKQSAIRNPGGDDVLFYEFGELAARPPLTETDCIQIRAGQMRAGVAGAYSMGVAVHDSIDRADIIPPRVKPFVATYDERLFKGRVMYIAFVGRRDHDHFQQHEEKVYCWNGSVWIQVKHVNWTRRGGGFDEKKTWIWPDHTEPRRNQTKPNDQPTKPPNGPTVEDGWHNLPVNRLTDDDLDPNSKHYRVV